MSADASKGKTALDNNDYQSAVKYFSAALKSSQAPLWLLQRSTAHHRLGNYHLALQDANNALLVANNRGKRELIADAHYRRGIIYHGLKQYGNSRMCFHWCRKYNEKQRGLSMWISKIATDYDANGGEQAECNEVTVKELPEMLEVEDDHDNQSIQSSLEEEDKETRKGNLVNHKPSSNIRHEWYQSQNNVTVEILVKAVSKEATTVEVQEKSLKISFPDPSSSSICNFFFEPLYSKIELSKSSHRVTPHKIEVLLHKSIPGLKWPTLQSSDSNLVGETIASHPEISSEVRNPKLDLKAPAYPTSSKSGPKNWDTLVKNEVDEDGDEGADAFFKTLYKNADPDTKRAMIKSYQESNGTSLSTQWSDVGNRKVETIPPDGLEAKRWDA